MQNVDMKKPIDSKTNNPCNFLFIGYGYLLKGDIETGTKYLKFVENYISKMDPDEEYLYEKVRERISS